jgi:hypothetical protein
VDDVVDLSVGPPGEPQVGGRAGEPAPEPKRDRSRAKPPAPTGLDLPDDPLPAVTMDQVRAVVMSAGVVLGMAFGDEDVPDHWRFTEAELAALVPPLTAIINRRPALRRAVQRSDEATVAIVLAGYTGRNLDAWRAARRQRDAREGEAREVGGDAGPDRDGASGSGAGGEGGHGVPGSPVGGLGVPCAR